MANPRDPSRPRTSPDSDPSSSSSRESATATVVRPEASESKEKAEKEPRTTLRELEEKAEKVKADPGAEAAEAIQQLRGDKETAEQLDGMTAFNIAVVSLLAKLKKKGYETQNIRNGTELKKAVNDTAISLTLPERAVMENLDRLTSEKGPTSNLIMEEWPQRVETGNEAAKGWKSKLWKQVTPGNIGLLVAGAAAGYLTYQLFAPLVKKAIAYKNKDKNEDTPLWRSKKLWIPVSIGLVVLGGVIGKKAMMKLLADIGLDFDKILEKMKKGEELTKEEAEKAEEATKKLGEEVKKRREAGEAGTGGAEGSDKENGEEGAEGSGGGSDSTEKAKEEAKEAVAEAKEKTDTVLAYEGPRDILVRAYCFDNYEYDNQDIPQISRAIDDMKDSRISDVHELWVAHNNNTIKGSIPNTNRSITFFSGLRGQNIYTAVMIISKTTAEYKQRYPTLDFSTLTVKEFLENHVHNDAVSKVTDTVKNAMQVAIRDASLTDLSSLTIDIGGIETAIGEIGGGMWKNLCIEYGVKLEEVNEAHFTAIMAYLYKNSTLEMDANDALKHFDTTSYDPKAVEAAKLIYTQVCEKTKLKIIPAAIVRFNLDRNMIRNADVAANTDIIKNKLSDKIPFKHAVHLNLVTREIDLGKTATEGSTAPQELAFLFTVIHSLPKEEQGRYMTELTFLLIKSPSKITLPSLALIQPYFGTIEKFAINHAKKKAKEVMALSDIFMHGRTDSARQDFLERMRTEDWISWGAETGLEATGGALQIPKAVILTLWDTNVVTANEIRTCENAWDFMLLIKKVGGTFLFGKDESGEHRGVIVLGGEYFIFRPLGIIKETFLAALDGDVTGAFKVWTVGSAPFVAFGALHGYFEANRAWHGWLTLNQTLGVVKGVGRGFAYPYYALRTTATAASRTTKAAVVMYQATREYSGRPGYGLRQGVRGAKEILLHGSLQQNVANLLENGERFMEYRKSCNLDALKWSDWLEYLRHDKTSLVKALAGNFNEKMAVRYAERYVTQYNNFFGFKPTDAGRLTLAENSLNLDTIGKAHLNLKRFMKEVADSDDVLENMMRLGKTLRGQSLSDAILSELKKIAGLDPHEYEALGKQLKNKDGIEAFVRRLREGVQSSENLAKASGAGLGTRLQERFRRPTDAESSRSFGKSKEALEAAEKDLDAMQKRMASARADINLVERMRKGPQFEAQKAVYQERLTEARKIIAHGELAEAELKRSVAAMRRVTDVESKLADIADLASPEASKLTVELHAAEEAAEDALRASNRASEGIGRLGRLGTAAKWAGRGLVLGGAVFSGYEALSSGYEAITTDVEGRSAIRGAEAGLWTLNAIADGAAVAVMFGAEGAGVTYASTAAAPLIPLTYAGATVAETLYEETKTDYEWIQESGGNPYALLHHFYTSVNSVSLGDAWTTVGSESLIERRNKAKLETMRRIYRGLVAIQKDPSILEYLQKTPSSEAKNREIEKRINENYSVYHEFYFRNMNTSDIQSYGTAQELVLEAQMYDDIMKERDKNKAEGKPFVLMGNDKHPYNLHLERYDVLGGLDNPHGKINYNPLHIVQAYKESMLRIFESDAVLKGNLERMDSAYLIRLYIQICRSLDPHSTSKSTIDAEEGLREELVQQASSISAYLKSARHVNMVFAMMDPAFREPVMSLEEIKNHLDSFGSIENKAFLEFEKKTYKMTPALQSVYRLAEYFGYTGIPDDAGLKDFFHAGAASYQGLYWDGKEWVLQKRGWDLDDKLGPELNEKMIRVIIKTMRDQPDNILEHRSDTIFMDSHDYTHEVTKMARIMESGLKEGVDRGYTKN